MEYVEITGMAKDEPEIAAYSAALNHLADDEAETVAYGNGVAWVAKDENEAEIAAHDPHKNLYSAVDEYNLQRWGMQEKDEDTFLDWWNEAEREQWNEYDVKDDNECWDEEEIEYYEDAPDWWHEATENEDGAEFAET